MTAVATVGPVLLGRFTPGTPEWWEARRRRLGGSEIAAVLGLSPFESRFSLWHRKMGTAAPQPQRPEMEWGNRLEPVVLARFFEGPDRRRGGGGASYAHPERPWQVATPDALLDTGATSELVEVKTSPMGEGWGPAGTDEIPIYYRCQVLWYLDALGLELAHIAVLISGYDYREYRLTLDEQARVDVESLRWAGADFIASLENNERPPIDGHDQTYRVLREMHPDIDAGEEHDLGELGLDYLATKAALTVAEQTHKTIRHQVFDVMGIANYGTYLGERIVRRQANQGGPPFLASTRKDPRGGTRAAITDKENV